MKFEPLLISINEAARLLGVSRSSIYRLIREETLPVRKVRSRTLIEVERLRGLSGGEA
ncbi:MAG: helix-turn-helix domain-containing protein [Sphingomonas sp.]